jgi:hypothetical protein
MLRIEACLRLAYIVALCMLLFGLPLDHASATVTAKDFPDMIPQQNGWMAFFRFVGYFGSLIAVCVFGIRKGCPPIDTIAIAIFLTPIGGAIYVYLYKVPGAEEAKKEAQKAEAAVIKMSEMRTAPPENVANAGPTPAKKEGEAVVSASENPTAASTTPAAEEPAKDATETPAAEPVDSVKK